MNGFHRWCLMKWSQFLYITEVFIVQNMNKIFEWFSVQFKPFSLFLWFDNWVRALWKQFAMTIMYILYIYLTTDCHFATTRSPVIADWSSVEAAHQYMWLLILLIHSWTRPQSFYCTSFSSCLLTDLLPHAKRRNSDEYSAYFPLSTSGLKDICQSP